MASLVDLRKVLLAGFCSLGSLAIVTPNASGEEGPGAVGPFPLWSEGHPTLTEAYRGFRPTLTLYRPSPQKSTGSVIVVFPGGGYGGHADHEGKPVAEWLNGLGITAVVLKYRLAPDSRHPAMLDDAARAIRTVRANAGAWNVDPNRVGVVGFSAGGHLASTIATHFDAGRPEAVDVVERFSSRPDRAILIYPVISLVAPYTHGGSKRNLLGPDPAPGLAENLSNELQVTSETPPTFLAHTTKDVAVPPENSLYFALALRKANVPVELHLFEEGRHGLGLGQPGFAFSEWPQLCARWLDGQGFLRK